MKRTLAILVMISALVLLGCQRSARLSDEERAQMLNQIQQMLDAHSRSVESEGLQGSLKFFHNSPEFQWTYKGSSYSYDTLVSRIKSDQAKYQSVHLQWDSLAIEPLTSERVLFNARYQESIKDTTGKRFLLSGLVKGELIHLSDGWKFQSGRAK
jgi:hypothetical protein